MLRGSPFQILGTPTLDQAVAVCVNESIALVVLDGESIRGQEWSVVKSLKMVRPTLRIALLEQRKSRPALPSGVDAAVPMGSLDKLSETIKSLLNSKSRVVSSSQH